MSNSSDLNQWLVRRPRQGETCVFSHGYWEAAYLSSSERVAHWKRDALLFDRVYARYGGSDAPPDIPLELSFGIDSVEQSLGAWDSSMSAQMAQAFGTPEIMEKELGTNFDVGHDSQLANEYSQAGIMGEWSYASTGAFLRRFSAGEQVAYEGALSNIPIVSAGAAPWDQILAFRNDPEAVRKYRDLRLWLRSGLKAESSQHAADIIGQKIDDYRWSIKRHGLQTSLGALKTVFDWKESKLTLAATGFAAVMGGPAWAAVAGGLSIAMQVGAWLTERRLDANDISRGPNREVAVLYDIQKKFGE